MTLLLLLLEDFSHQLMLIVFHWSLSDSKSPQISRTLLSILADLNNVVVLMVFTRPFIFKSPSPFINPLVNVHRVSIIIGYKSPFHVPHFFSVPQ